MKKHAIWRVVLGTSLLALGTSACDNSTKSNPSDSVYEDSLITIEDGNESVGTTGQYSGVVISDAGQDVKKDETRTVVQTFVEVGDPVHIGTPLFRYDTEDLSLKLTQAELELTGISNKIATLQSQLDTLIKERDKAKEADKLSYTLQIQSTELDIRTEEYNTTVKQMEIDRIKLSMENVDVCSEIDGIVQEINEDGGYDNSGQPLPFIKLATTTNYRVKGRINEMNSQNIYQGMPVEIVSRINPDIRCLGTIQEIDYSNTDSDNNNGMVWVGGNQDSMNQSSNYAFYVEFNEPTDLLLGQHVYIVPTEMGGTFEEVMP